MIRLHTAATAAILGAAGLVLAACGGGASSSSSSVADPASSAAETSAAASGSASAPDAECANETLKIGTLLPATGDLAFLGPAMFAAAELAVEDVNAAGGVLGAPMVSEYGDSGDTQTDLASQTVDSHLGKGVQVVLGAASSGVTYTVIDKITGNGVLQISPANTAPGLTDYPDDGLYFRTAPSDALQGAVIAGLAIDAGYTEGATIARAEPYGEGLQNAFINEFTGAGGTIVSQITYDPTSPSFEAEVAQLKESNPEFIQVVGFDESVKLIQEMIKQGIGPQDVPLYLVDGNLSSTAYEGFPAGTMTGVLATGPTPDPGVDFEAFNARILEKDAKATDYSYAGQTYDAVVLAALAADYAGCADARAIADALPQVANGDAGGTACTTYAECLAIIEEGGQPDYNGVSGPLDFNEFGDAKTASIALFEYVTNTKYDKVEVIGPVEVPVP